MQIITPANAWQQRVIDERTELELKISKLAAFLDTDHESLAGGNRAILEGQLGAMVCYATILAIRISRFED